MLRYTPMTDIDRGPVEFGKQNLMADPRPHLNYIDTGVS